MSSISDTPHGDKSDLRRVLSLDSVTAHHHAELSYDRTVNNTQSTQTQFPG